jgi:UDP-glucose 4-epimerase
VRKTVLVVGGAGYIGSHMVKALLDAGHTVTILDNLSTGHRDAVLGGQFVLGDIGDTDSLELLLSKGQFDAVMHFAGSNQISESVLKPEMYYRNNVVNTLNLLDAMLKYNVRYLVFSSTAAIYGNSEMASIDENQPQAPLTSYGRSKLMIEQILADYDQAHGLKSACLRYFNAAGADPSGLIGERHKPETHLIPLSLDVVLGKQSCLSIYGNDYDTPDGTCIRDYIHVNDICKAHLLALELLQRTEQSLALNLGNGQGFSIREVIETVRIVTGHPLPIQFRSRRSGDPARLIANSQRACKCLGWTPDHPDIRIIVEHAWRWARNQAELQASKSIDYSVSIQ